MAIFAELKSKIAIIDKVCKTTKCGKMFQDMGKPPVAPTSSFQV